MDQVKRGKRLITSRLACLRQEELLAVARVAGGSCSSSAGEPVRSESSVAR
jgi:hypothetical protein